MTVHTLPAPVAAYFEASNKGDMDSLAASFTDDAMVNDQQREFWGKAAIRAWADHEIRGSKVTSTVVEVRPHHGNVIVSARIDGDFDRTGLPDPLILHFYFSVHGEKISQLIILLNKPAA